MNDLLFLIQQSLSHTYPDWCSFLIQIYRFPMRLWAVTVSRFLWCNDLWQCYIHDNNKQALTFFVCFFGGLELMNLQLVWKHWNQILVITHFHLYFSNSLIIRAVARRKLMTEAMSMENLWPRQSVHGWVFFLGIKSVYNDYKQQKWKKLPRQVPRVACY